MTKKVTFNRGIYELVAESHDTATLKDQLEALDPEGLRDKPVLVFCTKGLFEIYSKI